MAGPAFFTYAAELLKLHPPHVTDQPILAQMKRIGIEPGKSFEMSKLDPVVQKAISDAPASAQQLMHWKLPTLARVANGWSMNTDTMGVYGNYYLKRAIVLGNHSVRTCQRTRCTPLNIVDSEGKTLDGSNKYVIRFEKGNTPPANAFWSITLYDNEGFQVANSLNRFTVGGWIRFKPTPMARWSCTSRTRVRARIRSRIGCPRLKVPTI